MAGIYVHIPYCKQACYYCDFHFSTNRNSQEDMVTAIVAEIRYQQDFFGPNNQIKTIYFGGGTPSLLTKAQLNRIIDEIKMTFDCSGVNELTLEANPDDLSEQNLSDWKSLGVDRLSIGIQSFNEAALKFCNRAHNAAEAITAIEKSKSAGFSKFSIDLIYGIPVNTMEDWKHDVEMALQTGVDHISAYCLTLEPKTVFGKWHESGKLPAIDQDIAADQYDYLVVQLAEAGFEHYEVSNFARNGSYAIHNTSYWFYEPYLGVGPGAHGFDGYSRYANPRNNAAYIKSWEASKPAFTVETLDKDEQVAEYLLTSLRTQWGCDLLKLQSIWQFDLMAQHQPQIESWVTDRLAILSDNHLILTDKGRLMADHLTLKLLP